MLTHAVALLVQDIHKELEGAISKFHGTDDTILYPSCFDANAGLFEAILDNRDAVISDQLNHASIIDGIRLCKAERHRYNHLDMLDLEEKLKATQHARVRLIATDGVFSMDGDVAPLKYVKIPASAARTRTPPERDSIVIFCFQGDCSSCGNVRCQDLRGRVPRHRLLWRNGARH